MTTIKAGDFDPARYYHETVIHGIIERCYTAIAPPRGNLRSIAVKTGTVSSPAEGTLPSDSDFSATVNVVKPKLFVSHGNTTELALLHEGLDDTLQQGMVENLKAAIEFEIIKVLLAANKTADDPPVNVINYETDALKALEKWTLKGNLLSRAYLIMHADLIPEVYKDVFERFDPNLFNFLGVPCLFTGKQVTTTTEADDGTITTTTTDTGLLKENTGMVVDLRQVTLVPYQEATVTADFTTNPTLIEWTGRAHMGIHIQNPDAVYVFNPNSAPA